MDEFERVWISWKMVSVPDSEQLEFKLASVLPARVGSPLSINNLRQDLEVAFYQVHTGAKDVEFAGHRARILPLTALAGILKV